MNRKTHFRKGQLVRQAGTNHVFRIAASMKGDRIFREKGTNLWYGRNEIERIRDTKHQPKALSTKKQNRAASMRALALQAIPPERLPKPIPPRKRKCAWCGLKFEPGKKWARFCSDAHRWAFWKLAKSKGAA